MNVSVTMDEPLAARRRPEEPAAGPAEARLKLVFRARQGRTYLAAHAASNPLKVVRPFALPGGGALVQILFNAPGMFADDHYQVEIVVERDSRVVLMSPSATKLHQMPEGGRASQGVRVRVESGACLQYFPALNIPFPDAEFRQSISVELEAESRLGIVEAWAMGRVERGEHLRFRRLSSRTLVNAQGQPAYRDALELTPNAARLAGWGLLEGSRYLVSGYWYGPPIQTPEAFAGKDLHSLAVLGAFEPAGHYFRGLFHDSLEMQRAIAEVARAVDDCWKLPAVSLQPFHC